MPRQKLTLRIWDRFFYSGSPSIQLPRLDTVTNVALSDDGVASWDNIANEVGFSVQLYKDGAVLNSPATVGENVLTVDFFVDIAGEGIGDYHVVVTALGDNVTYRNSLPSDPSNTITVAKLDTPTNLAWSDYLATWDVVTDAVSYDVQLYKDDVAEGSVINTATDSVDFQTQIEGITGTYHFTVQAKGEGLLIINSDISDNSSSKVEAPLVESLIVAYEMNEASGEIVYDSHGSSIDIAKNNSTSVITLGTPPLVSSSLHSVHFSDRTANRWLDGGAISQLSFSDTEGDLPFTFSTFINRSSTTGVNCGLAEKVTQWFIIVRTTNKILVRLYDDDTAGYIGAEGSTLLLPDTNYLVNVTYDSSGSWSGIKIYINGVQETTGNVSSGTYTKMLNGTTNFRIGTWESGSARFEGYIDQTYFFNKELSQPEIDYLYNDGDGRSYNELSIPIQVEQTFLSSADYYVSSSEGNDSNDGLTEETAWASIAKVNSETFTAGEVIAFKADDIFEGTLTPASSGTGGSPIIFNAYGTGKKPRIYGSTEITGWTLHSGNIYKAAFGSEVKQVFVNNVRMKLARYEPANTYSYPSTILSTTQFEATSLNAGIDYVGTNCIYRGFAYAWSSREVTASSGNTLTIASAPSGGIATTKGFILTNKLEFLTEAGMWWQDSGTNEVYLWTPIGADPSSSDVRVSTVENGIDIWSKNYLTFKNFELSHFTNSGFLGNNCNNITIDNCNIKDNALYGVFVGGGTQTNFTVTNNKVYRSPSRGVIINGTGSVIEDNLVFDSGRLDDLALVSGLAHGLYSNGANASVRYNKVFNSGYNGIQILGINVILAYNLVDGACTELDDGGGIYSYNQTYTDDGISGSVIENNIVLNVIGRRDGFGTSYDAGTGIYMDNGIHDVTLRNNTVYNAGSGMFLNAENRSNTIQGNTIINAAMLFSTHNNLVASNVNNNIFYATDKLWDYVWWNDGTQRLARINGTVATMDNNRYIQHYSSSNLFNDGAIYLDFNEWKTYVGGEASSTIDLSTLAVGETEELFYNATKVAKYFTLPGSYRDLDGGTVASPLLLQPFTSQILIKE